MRKWCAGLVVRDNYVTEAAPILAWTVGKRWATVVATLYRWGARIALVKC